MSNQDPIDQLLNDAFAAERRALPAAPVAGRVLARIRRRRRLRQAVLGSGVAIGLAATVSTGPPLLAQLAENVAANLPQLWSVDAATTTFAIVTLVLLLGTVVLLDEEPGAL